MARVKQTARMSTGGKAPRRSKQENKPKSRGGRRVKQTARMSTGGKAPRGQALIEYEESLEKEKELMARKNTIEAEKKMLTEAAKTPVKNAEALVKKGDVVWVRYRQDPLWPALVQNVQPKKMTYVFFPLSKNDSEKKPQLFSCNPNSVYCLSVAEKPQVGAPKDVLKALKEAKLYLINEGRLEGSAMIPRPDAELMSDEERKKEFPLPIILDVQPRAETKKNEKDSSGDAKEKEEEGVDVGVEILEDDEEEVKEVKKVEKIKKNEVVKQDKEVKKKEEDKKNEEVKKGDVVKKVEESKKNEEVKKDDVVKKVEESKKNEVKKGEEFKQDVELNKEQVKDDEKKEEEVKEDEEPAQKKARLDSPSSTKQGTSGADEDLNAFAEVVEKNYSTILELLYTEKTATEHVVPFRRDIGFSMNCSRFLSDHDTDVLFENIMDFVKNKEGLCRSLPAFHFVCDFLFPEVIIRSFMIHRRIGYEAAKRIVFRPEESNGDTAWQRCFVPIDRAHSLPSSTNMSMETGGQPKMKEKLIKKKSQLEGMEDEETAFKQTNAPVKTTDALIKRGDVVWVRWRRSPLWPALVHNVQPKKMTYVFFPLPKNDNGKKPQLFSCNPNSVYRVSVTEKTPFGASKDLVEALKEAKLRIFKDGKVEGSAAILRPESKPMTEKEIKRAFPLLRIETRNEKDTGKQNKEDSDGDDGNAEDKEKRKGVIESEEPAKKRAREDLSIPAKEESSRAAEAFVQKLQENYKPILEQLYAEEIVSFSNVPDRRDIRISMASACFLSDDNADILYENIVDFVREKNQKNRLSLLALHFVAQSLFPEVIARCLMIHRRISYEKAKRVVHPPEF